MIHATRYQTSSFLSSPLLPRLLLHTWRILITTCIVIVTTHASFTIPSTTLSIRRPLSSSSSSSSSLLPEKKSNSILSFSRTRDSGEYNSNNGVSVARRRTRWKMPLHHQQQNRVRLRIPSTFSSGSSSNNIGNTNQISSSPLLMSLLRENIDTNENPTPSQKSPPPPQSTRRDALAAIFLLSSTTAAATSFPRLSAAKSELDSKSGELFSPKAQMLFRGGSDAARGTSIRNRTREEQMKVKREGLMQTVYETRFIAYLSRFLLTFDPAARAWWKENLSTSTDTPLLFAGFAESVEVGLTDYFLGPYGSYASVEAAKAGLTAAASASSTRSQRTGPAGARQGILNLLALLQARYTSTEEKRQLAMLFSLISDPYFQPTKQITALLGEAENATVSRIELEEGEDKGGYSVSSPPKVTIDPPPALGTNYKPAKAEPVLEPSSRVLSITVVDGGDGYYRVPPIITVSSQDLDVPSRQCRACAILDGRGGIESIVVLDPGKGYSTAQPPKVTISPPPVVRKKKGKQRRRRRAQARAEWEYCVTSVKITEEGNGYATTQPPKVILSPPAEIPDWYLGTPEEERGRVARVTDLGSVSSSGPQIIRDGNYDDSFKLSPDLISELTRQPTKLLPLVTPILRDGRYVIPNLPATTIPLIRRSSGLYRDVDPLFGGVGKVPVTKTALQLSFSEYSRLALSGAICTILVRTALNPLELVKTKIQLGNDEELIEIVQQRAHAAAAAKVTMSNGSGEDVVLRTEEEEATPGKGALETRQSMPMVMNNTDLHREIPALPAAAATLEKPDVATETPTTSSLTKTPQTASTAKLDTIPTIQALLQLRGTKALFQSADITFLSSLVFGSFGFGATELFRRAFTLYFFESTATEETQLETLLTYLAAAGVACIVTCAIAAPFELVRVRSMATKEGEFGVKVLTDLVEDNRRKKSVPPSGPITLKDLPPLWSGFTPIVSRELPFAITKFLAFDTIARLFVDIINSILASNVDAAAAAGGAVQVGVGPVGLGVSALAGALAGICGALVSHPADLLLTLTSSSSGKKTESTDSSDGADSSDTESVWTVLKELLEKEGGVKNLFVGLPARSAFFFLVIGLQFFLYDFVKTLLEVGSDDLTLVLDVFYAVRQGLL